MNKIIICLNCKIQKLLTSQRVIPRHVTVCILKKNSEGREKYTCSTRPSKYLVLRISRVRVFSLAFCLSPKFGATKEIGFHHFSKLASMYIHNLWVLWRESSLSFPPLPLLSFSALVPLFARPKHRESLSSIVLSSETQRKRLSRSLAL